MKVEPKQKWWSAKNLLLKLLKFIRVVITYVTFFAFPFLIYLIFHGILTHNYLKVIGCALALFSFANLNKEM